MNRTTVMAALGAAQTPAWASSYYLPAIFADPIAQGTGVSRTVVFGLFSGARLLSAVSGRRSAAQTCGWYIRSSRRAFRRSCIRSAR